MTTTKHDFSTNRVPDIKVGARTLRLMRKLLRSQPEGLTIAELADITRKSRNTVGEALRALKAEADTAYWPRRWHLPEEDAEVFREMQLGSSQSNVLVPLVKDEDWVTRWNGAYKRMGEGLAKLSISTEDDPDKLLADLTAVASGVASVAHALQLVKDSPDWYARLGGKLGEEQFDAD